MELNMKIETGIPAPDFKKRAPSKSWPFKNMKVGDSVFFADEPNGTTSRPPIIAYNLAAKRRAAGRPITFSAKAIDGGVRIWRVE